MYIYIYTHTHTYIYIYIYPHLWLLLNKLSFPCVENHLGSHRMARVHSLDQHDRRRFDRRFL